MLAILAAVTASSAILEVITALAPSSVDIINKVIQRDNVLSIPHVVEIPKKPLLDKKILRIKHNIPLDRIVVCMVGANYELNYRRSYDTSIQAFKKYNDHYSKT